MKITKSQLKEMVRQVVRKKLVEMDLAEKGVEAETQSENDEKLSRDAVAKQLEQEKEKSRQKRAQKQRQAAKSSVRGMELECGPNMNHEEDSGEDDFLTKLESALLKNEQGRLG